MTAEPAAARTRLIIVEDNLLTRLGISTLLLQVPVVLGVAHQGGAVLVLAAAVCASLTWAYFDNAEQRALESRAAQLDAQVWQPGSPLACQKMAP